MWLLSKDKSGWRTRWSAGLAGCLAALVVLAGCTVPHREGRAEVSVAARVAQADLGYGPAALDRAVAQFLVPSGAAAPSGGLFRPSAGGGGDRDARADRPRPRATLEYSDLDGQDLALVATATQAFTQGWQVQYALRAGQGQARYVIPAGQLRVPVGSFAVVIDEPTALQASARFVEADALVLRDLRLALPGRITLGAGAGLRATASRLRVTSGLLDIDSRHRQAQPYAVVQARYQPPRLPARAFVEGRAYGRRAAGLRAGVDLVWP